MKCEALFGVMRMCEVFGVRVCVQMLVVMNCMYHYDVKIVTV